MSKVAAAFSGRDESLPVTDSLPPEVRPDVNTGAGRQGPGGQKTGPRAAPTARVGIGNARRSGQCRQWGTGA